MKISKALYLSNSLIFKGETIILSTLFFLRLSNIISLSVVENTGKPNIYLFVAFVSSFKNPTTLYCCSVEDINICAILIPID